MSPCAGTPGKGLGAALPVPPAHNPPLGPCPDLGEAQRAPMCSQVCQAAVVLLCFAPEDVKC